MISRSVCATSGSNRSVLIIYSPLLAGTYSFRPTYSTLKMGFLPNVLKNSLAVWKVRKGGVTASMTPYSGTNTEICISTTDIRLQGKKIVCHNLPLKLSFLQQPLFYAPSYL